jgi:hypothetical protein
MLAIITTVTTIIATTGNTVRAITIIIAPMGDPFRANNKFQDGNLVRVK